MQRLISFYATLLSYGKQNLFFTPKISLCKYQPICPVNVWDSFPSDRLFTAHTQREDIKAAN